MAKLLKSVKAYILLGYLTLIMIASVTVWVIYDETLNLYDNQIDMNPVSDKIFLANSILTGLYEAENLKRSYLQTENPEHYQAYNTLLDTISSQITLLGAIEGSPWHMVHTDSLQSLLDRKRETIDELKAIKTSVSSEKLYERALLRLTQNKDSLEQLFNIYTTINTSKDSIIIKQRKARFFDRLINVFAPPVESDSSLKIIVNESIQVDSIFGTFNPTDSVKQILSSIINDIQKETNAIEQQLIQKEQENLDNAQTITLQIRKIIAQLENEEIMFSLRKVATQQEHIRNMTNIVIVLGGAALLVITGFLILILKDISRSQHYRQNLEKEKAYSESLLKSKQQLMLSITHDLKSPLNSISGFAHLAAIENAPDLKNEYLNNIEQSTSYISRLINDLLDFARLETGKMTIERSTVKLKKLVEEVVSGFYPTAREKELELILDIERLPDKLYLTDETRIQQILSNLLSNALKFTDKGSVKVNGKLKKSKGKTDWIQFTVEDTGIGISKENADLIFEEFSRISTADQRHYEGTGLGLTITKRIVELLDGSIKCISHIGKGSRFIIELPFQKLLTNEVRDINNNHPESEKINISFNKEKVLLVDDDPFLLELTTHVLKEANLTVYPFNQTSKAIELMESQTFDLLITDVQMPGKNGFDLLSIFRSKNPPEIPAIAITGETNDEQHYIKAGFAAVLQKPFQPKQLINTVSYILLNGSTEIQVSPPETNENSTSYNIEDILAFASGDMETTKEILTSFTHSTAENLHQFKNCVQSGKHEELKQLAHKMLPMFRQLHASEIIEPLRKFEQYNYEYADPDWHNDGTRLMLKIENLMEKIIQDYQLPFSGKLIS